jgi:hypothetical protein
MTRPRTLGFDANVDLLKAIEVAATPAGGRR